MLYYSAVRLKVTRSLFGGKYRHFFVAYTLCLSSFQVIMCREMRKLNVWCEETCSVQSLAIWLLFNKVPFDHLSLHLYPFVIAAIDWLLEPRACGKVCPANKWANLLQHQEKKTKKQTKKKRKTCLFCSLWHVWLWSPQVSLTAGGWCPLASLRAAVVEVFITRVAFDVALLSARKEFGLKEKGASAPRSLKALIRISTKGCQTHQKVTAK